MKSLSKIGIKLEVSKAKNAKFPKPTKIKENKRIHKNEKSKGKISFTKNSSEKRESTELNSNESQKIENQSSQKEIGLDGPIQEMDRVYQSQPLTMGWCMECHRGQTTPKNVLANVYPGMKNPHGPVAPVNCDTCHN